MHTAEISKYDLEHYRTAIEAASKPCTIGVPSRAPTESWFGGMPLVDGRFEWPRKNGYPLHFIGQLKCSEIERVPFETGYLLFFYDNRHYGYSPHDLGHAVVLHQQGQRAVNESELPEYEVKTLFGLLKRRVRPKVFQRVNITLQESCSYPSFHRELIPFKHDDEDDQYGEFCAEVHADIKIGGYPDPIQSDDMEEDCVKAFDLGQPQDWKVLLQLFEIGDMVWGDAGALYWFIHRDDLAKGRLDRVWLVSQCH